MVGAGNWGLTLARNLDALGALAAVADPDPLARAAIARAHPAAVLFDHHEGLLESGVPAVVIATPSPSHHTIARQALLAGKDVFVEKPVALSTREAEELVSLARTLDRVLMAGHLLLHQPAVRWLKAYLDGGRLGTVYSFNHERLDLGRACVEENALWSLGVHDVAALLYLVGEAPQRVFASGQAVVQPDVEDDVRLRLEFRSGLQAHLHASWLWPEKRRRLTVVGERGMLVYDEFEQTVRLHRKRIGRHLDHHDEGHEIVFHGNPNPLRLELEHFLDRLEDRAAPLSDGESAARVVRVLEEASRRLRALEASL